VVRGLAWTLYWAVVVAGATSAVVLVPGLIGIDVGWWGYLWLGLGAAVGLISFHDAASLEVGGLGDLRDLVDTEGTWPFLWSVTILSPFVFMFSAFAVVVGSLIVGFFVAAGFVLWLAFTQLKSELG
jgi:hypothetical protein